jgi:hypothetical protein
LIADFANEGDLVRNASERNDCAILERNRLGQPVKLPFEPLHMTGKEFTCVFDPHFLR